MRVSVGKAIEDVLSFTEREAGIDVSRRAYDWMPSIEERYPRSVPAPPSTTPDVT